MLCILSFYFIFIPKFGVVLANFVDWVDYGKMINGIVKEPFILDRAKNGGVIEQFQTNLAHLINRFNEFDNYLQRTMKSLYLKQLTSRRIENPLKCAQNWAHEIALNSDNLKYSELLTVKTRSIILGLKREFNTLLVEVKLETILMNCVALPLDDFLGETHKIWQFVRQNETHCQKEAFERAKETLAKANGIQKKGETSPKQNGTNNLRNAVLKVARKLYIDAKIGILEREFATKISDFMAPLIDLERLLSFEKAIETDSRKIGEVIGRADLEGRKKIGQTLENAKEGIKRSKKIILELLNIRFKRLKQQIEQLSTSKKETEMEKTIGASEQWPTKTVKGMAIFTEFFFELQTENGLTADESVREEIEEKTTELEKNSAQSFDLLDMVKRFGQTFEKKVTKGQ
ncbi:hypothetical protein niasHS_008797 [Heterodera schachtii]|uniref:Uncharacterized protein n=1 Tax=Heterodera schachtii TaxID=97005 RepID=A0ABD2J997_HETSC